MNSVLWMSLVALGTVGLGCGSTSSSSNTIGPDETAGNGVGVYHAPAVYRMQLTDGDTALQMTLWLQVAQTEIRADLPNEPGRASRRANLRHVRCDEVELTAMDDGYVLPPGCSVLTWQVPFRSMEADGLHPQHLRSIQDPEAGLYLVTGASTFLIPESLTERPSIDFRLPESVAVHHQLPEAGGLGHTLPPKSQLGRVFFGLGSFRSREQSIGNTLVRHFSDADVTIDLEGMALGLQYLSQKSGTPPPRTLDIFWFARPHGQVRRLEGAAGLDSIVANYYSGIPEDAAVTVRRAPLAVLFQHYFASLAGRRVPGWMSRSLGQFYALHAWVQSGAIPESDLEHMIGAGAVRNPETTVLAAFRQWSQSGSDDDYRTFYRLGFGFWVALDRHLSESTDGERTLDDALEGLLGLVYNSEGLPPRRFIQIFDELGAEGAGEVTRPFLGWPEAPQE